MVSGSSALVLNSGVLADMQIKTKILAGFAVVLAILISALAFAYFTFVAVSHDVDEYAHYVEEAALISEIETQFLRFNSHAREFANTADPADAEAVFTYAKQLELMLKDAQSQFMVEEHRNRIEHIAEELDAYLASFASAKNLSDEYHSLILDRLEPDGIKIVADLDKLVAHAQNTGDLELLKRSVAAREHALLARLYANILIGRQDDSFGAKSADEFAKLETALGSIGDQPLPGELSSVLKEAKELFADYRQVFDKVRADELEIVATVHGTMREASEGIIADAEALKQELAVAEHNIFEKVVAEIILAEKEILIASIGGAVLGMVLAWVMGDRLSRPITAITTIMRRLANHDLGVEIPGQTRKDEIGQMAQAVQVFKTNAIRNDELEAEARAQEERSKEEQRRFMNQTADSFTTSVGTIIEAVAAAAVELQATATGVSQIANSASEQTTAVASASEEASGNVDSVASATEELNSSIEEINRQVVFSNEIAKKAVDQARETMRGIKELVEASNNIDHVLKLITDISDQTNMLALNATIEASRAGDAGKGFAVVANEVKNLANQVAKATEQITGEIEGVQNIAGEVAGVLGAIRTEVEDVLNNVTTISSAVEEQTAVTQQVSSNMQSMANSVEQFASSVNFIRDASSIVSGNVGRTRQAALVLAR